MIKLVMPTDYIIKPSFMIIYKLTKDHNEDLIGMECARVNSQLIQMFDIY